MPLAGLGYDLAGPGRPDVHADDRCVAGEPDVLDEST